MAGSDEEIMQGGKKKPTMILMGYIKESQESVL